MKDSKPVDEAIKNLYAVLATAAAKRALEQAQCSDDPTDADVFVKAAGQWLRLAGARATRWEFRLPRP